MYLLKQRSVITTFSWTQSHRGILGNEEANKLAKVGARRSTPNHLDLSIPKEFDIQGAKLAMIDQSIVYRGILKKKKTPL